MKKVLAVLIILASLLSVFACKGEDAQTSGGQSPSASDTPQGSPSAPSGGVEESNPAQTPGTAGDLVGYWEDDVDYFSREPYNLCYAMPAISIMHETFMEAFRELESQKNFKLVTSSGDNNTETYLQNLEIMAAGDVDGFLVDSEPTIRVRTKEILDDLDIPYLAFIQTLFDDNDHADAPVVMLSSYDCGEKQAQWFIDNYKTYLPDAAPEEIALLPITITTSPDFFGRSQGAIDLWSSTMGIEPKVVTLDLVNQAMDAIDSLVNTIITTNPDVKYWWIISTTDMFATGPARAIEALNLNDKTIITSVGLDFSRVEWEAGYEGCWKATLGISTYDTVGPAIAGLIALIDGRTTPDTIWKERAKPNDMYGNKYGIWYVETEMVTKETYAQFLAEKQAKYIG
jgi:ABC-type sugar transport system substrate-binding protein